MQKRIIALITSLGLGGAEGVFISVINYFFRCGYRITVLVGTKEGDVHSKDFLKGIYVKELGFSSARDALITIIKYVRKNDFDCAISFVPELSVDLQIAKFITRRNFVNIGRCINTLSDEYRDSGSLFRKYITSSVVKRIYKQIDVIIAQSTTMKSDLIENFGIDSQKIKIINNPLAEKYEKELDLPTKFPKSNYILYVGRFERQKRIDILINAFSRIENKNMELYLVGNGSLKGELEALVEKFGIGNRVKFQSFTDGVEKYYREAAVTALTSNYEGFPNVLIEANACGSPVVTFDKLGGSREIVIDSVNGFLVEYMNIEELVGKLNLAIQFDWNYKSIKESAQRFTGERIMFEYQSIIDSLAVR